MGGTHTHSVLLNSSVSFACQLVNVLVNFVCRTIFTYSLGKSYLGVMGVFTNIITVLSIAEMGIDTAVLYRLYRPVAEQDSATILRYVGFLRRFFMVIAVGFLVIGLAVTPVIPFLVQSPDVKEDVRLLFNLYILQTVSTYVFASKKILLTADQKEYLVAILDQVVNIVFTGIECVVLVLTKNYVIYCILVIAYRLVSNGLCSLYASRKYPELSGLMTEKLKDSEKKGIRSDMRGLIMTRVATTAFNGTDSLFISVFLGVDLVGVLSNYTLILSTFNTFVNRSFGAITASIGNLSVKGSSEETEDALQKMFFLNALCFGFIFLVVTASVRSIVTDIWLGESFSLPYMTVLLVNIEILLRSLHFPIKTIQNALGLFAKYRFVTVVAALLNLVLDYLLVQPMGVCGLMLSTIFCRILIYIVDILIVYRLGFKKSSCFYFRTLFCWLIVFLGCIILTQCIIYFLPLNGMLGVALRIIIASIVYICVVLFLFAKNRIYIQIRATIMEKIRKRAK